MSESSFAAEYIASEQVAPDSANELLTPLDGFSEDVVETTERGFVGREVGSYFPILSEVFSESVLTLAPRFYYFHTSTDGEIREEAAYGGKLTLLSGWLKDSLRFGFSGATSQALYTPEGRGGTGLLQSGGTSYWAPGEAYGEIRYENLFHATLFRQEMNLPYFNRNDTRMTPRVHEAYQVVTDVDPQFRVGAVHITRVKSRTGEDFVSMSDAAGAVGSNRGVTLAGFRYQWRDEKSDIGVLNAIGWDTFNTFYTESTHRWELPNEFEFNLSGQFVNQDSIGQELLGVVSTSTFGARAALGREGLVASLSATSTSQGGQNLNPWGGSPLYNSVMISDFDRAGEDTWGIGLSYPFDRIGLPWASASANYVQGHTPDSGPIASPDQREFNVNFDVRPEVSVLEDFWLRFRYGRNEGHTGATRETFRVILNYSMDF